MANIEQTQQMIPFVTCEISLGQHVGKLGFLVSMYLIWILGPNFSIEQPIKRNSVGPGNMSHCGTPSVDDHLDHCFIVFEHIQQSFLMRRFDFEGINSTLSKSLTTL